MSGVQENLARVREGIAAYQSAKKEHEQATDTHEQILRDHADAIRKHEREMRRHRHALDGHRRERQQQESEPSLRFRFKSGSERAHRHKRQRSASDSVRDEKPDQTHTRRNHKRSRSRSPVQDGAGLNAYTAHPFARPPASPPDLDPSASTSPVPNHDGRTQFSGPDDAFRGSLFDALADDEGAAYWEGVYSQPIHVYSRPKVVTEDGTLEQMTDEQYTDYVKTKMWERKNPHLVKERMERERRKMEQEKEQKDEHRGRNEGRPRRRNNAFMEDVDEALARGAKRKESKRWQQAWTSYLQKWEQLKGGLDQSLAGEELARAIPWPVAPGASQGLRKDTVDEFFRNAALAEGETRTSLLKAERFKWHPDKIQHRFGGKNVDEHTLKMVTLVFQTVDDLLAEEREKV